MPPTVPAADRAVPLPTKALDQGTYVPGSTRCRGVRMLSPHVRPPDTGANTRPVEKHRHLSSPLRFGSPYRHQRPSQIQTGGRKERNRWRWVASSSFLRSWGSWSAGLSKCPAPGTSLSPYKRSRCEVAVALAEATGQRGCGHATSRIEAGQHHLLRRMRVQPGGLARPPRFLPSASVLAVRWRAIWAVEL